MTGDLAGRSAVVTGGGSGIGAATAMALSERGSRVLVADLDGGRAEKVAGELEAAGTEAVAFEVDVAERAAVMKMTGLAFERFGTVDVLVCAAGITGSRAAGDTEDETWDRLLAVNLTGAFTCARAVLPGMAERGWGRIVTVASVAGLVAVRSDAAYCASKGGLIQLTRSIAFDYADRGITANAVCPGVIDTPLVRPLLEGEDTRRRLLAHTPLRRPGAAEEVAGLIAHLASPAGAFITGQAIAVDGGWSTH